MVLLLTNKVGFFIHLHLSFSASFFSQCTPIVGHGFVLDKYKCECRRGFYHPSRVALNGFKSGLQIPLWYKNTYCREVSDQNFESSKTKERFWDIHSIYTKKKNNLFLVDSHKFCLKFLLCLWMNILRRMRLWNFKLQTKHFNCFYCGNVYYVSVLSSSGSHRLHLNHRPVGL